MTGFMQIFKALMIHQGVKNIFDMLMDQ